MNSEELTRIKFKLAKCMLEVVDDPTQCRVIVETSIPTLGSYADNENLYFMIDRGTPPDSEYDPETGEILRNEDGSIIWGKGEVFDHWFVSDSSGDSLTLLQSDQVLEFFIGLAEAVSSIKIRVESF